MFKRQTVASPHLLAHQLDDLIDLQVDTSEIFQLQTYIAENDTCFKLAQSITLGKNLSYKNLEIIANIFLNFYDILLTRTFPIQMVGLFAQHNVILEPAGINVYSTLIKL